MFLYSKECSKCPYYLGMVQYVVSPCPRCEHYFLGNIKKNKDSSSDRKDRKSKERRKKLK